MHLPNVTVNQFCYTILCRYATGLTTHSSRHDDFPS